ncbi:MULTISPECIES: hypothetical protein [Streptomycetaceae]|uniref:hypothetical protein n=1 Tax=Streptomycetaceae TaxID=2062 RepID=UPI00093E4AF6|nr:hypothetical protein [Streptomyces sp. CB02056]OKI08806.1 hypothetical protein AMK13_10420 [Streptomyces sp. CB02056]
MTQQHITHAAELVVQAMLGTDPTPAAIVQALAAAGLLRTTPLEVYRASWDDDSLGLYVSRDAARARCLLDAAAARPESQLAWHPVTEDDMDEEYLAADGQNVEYYVTTVPVRLTGEF